MPLATPAAQPGLAFLRRGSVGFGGTKNAEGNRTGIGNADIERWQEHQIQFERIDGLVSFRFDGLTMATRRRSLRGCGGGRAAWRRFGGRSGLAATARNRGGAARLVRSGSPQRGDPGQQKAAAAWRQGQSGQAEDGQYSSYHTFHIDMIPGLPEPSKREWAGEGMNRPGADVRCRAGGWIPSRPVRPKP
jgi:hypothetical protein